MFGMSMGEIFILLVVGIVVVGPKNLPSMMRTAGQWITKIRRMSTDLRSQSGIDELIRQEGLEKEIQQIRSLSRVNVIDTIMSPVVAQAQGTFARRPGATAAATPALASSEEPVIRDTTLVERAERTEPLREREYPLLGCDAFGALPEDGTPYQPPAPDEVPEDETPSIELRESDASDEVQAARDDAVEPAVVAVAEPPVAEPAPVAEPEPSPTGARSET